MDRTEAKLLLQACRPDGPDASLPIFAEALRLVEQDPELKAWWLAQQVFDLKVSEKLKANPLPANLRASILAGHRMEKAPTRLCAPYWLAIAAALALLAVIGGQMVFSMASPKPLAATAYTDSVLPLIRNDEPDLGMVSADRQKLMTWLKERRSPMGPMPASLMTMPGIGCQTYAVHGRKVSLICFAMKDGRIAHLFMVEKNALQDPPPDGVPVFAQKGTWATAQWSNEGKSFLLATQDSPEALRSLL